MSCVWSRLQPLVPFLHGTGFGAAAGAIFPFVKVTLPHVVHDFLSFSGHVKGFVSRPMMRLNSVEASFFSTAVMPELHLVSLTG